LEDFAKHAKHVKEIVHERHEKHEKVAGEKAHAKHSDGRVRAVHALSFRVLACFSALSAECTLFVSSVISAPLSLRMCARRADFFQQPGAEGLSFASLRLA
jgi:hypothetical protein